MTWEKDKEEIQSLKMKIDFFFFKVLCKIIHLILFLLASNLTADCAIAASLLLLLAGSQELGCLSSFFFPRYCCSFLSCSLKDWICAAFKSHQLPEVTGDFATEAPQVV